MIVGLVGRLFRVLARLQRGASAADLDHVGSELLRLEARRAQLVSRTSSR